MNECLLKDSLAKDLTAQAAVDAELFGSLSGLKIAAKELVENFYSLCPEQRKLIFNIAAYLALANKAAKN